MDKEKVVISWSGGKDSTLALYRIIKSGKYEISCLLTTITQDFDRVTMHGVRRELMEKQAENLGFELKKVFIPAYAKNEIYEAKMREASLELLSKGIRKHVFGDIFLEDIRKYREENLRKLNLEGIWPLWGEDTRKLAKEFINLGFKAIICSIDGNILDSSFVGREFDDDFLSDLPNNVDPCGERGEFHSFVYDGPIFKNKVEFKIGEKVFRDNRFYFIDLFL